MWNADLLRCARASLQSTAWKTGTPSYSLTSMTLLTTEVGDKNQWNVRNNAALEVGVSKEIILESVFQQPGVKQTENSESSWHHCSIILRQIFNTPSHYSRLILLPISVYYLWLPLWVFPGNDNQVLILLQVIYKRWTYCNYYILKQFTTTSVQLINHYTLLKLGSAMGTFSSSKRWSPPWKWDQWVRLENGEQACIWWLRWTGLDWERLSLKRLE